MCRRGTRRRACCCRCGRPAGCRAVGRRAGAGWVAAALPPGRRHSYDDVRRRSRFLRAAARMRTSFHSKRTHTRGARTAARVVPGRIARSRLSRRPPPSVSHRTSDAAITCPVRFIIFKFFFIFVVFCTLSHFGPVFASTGHRKQYVSHCPRRRHLGRAQKPCANRQKTVGISDRLPTVLN